MPAYLARSMETLTRERQNGSVRRHVAEIKQASPEGSKLWSKNFYIPRLGLLNIDQHLPVLMSRFVAKLRALFDAGIQISKRVEFSEFGL